MKQSNRDRGQLHQVFAIALVSISLIGCATVCPIINVVADTAKEACPIVVEYLDDDGKTHKVQVPREYMMVAVKQAAAKAHLPSPKSSTSASVHVDAAPKPSTSAK